MNKPGPLDPSLYTGLLSFILIFGTGDQLFAQPTVSSSDTPQPSDTVRVYTGTNTGSLPGSAGANMTWDFSSLTKSDSNEFWYKSVSNPSYAGSNLKSEDSANGGLDIGYFNFTSNKGEIRGVNNNSGATIDYTPDPQLIHSYPLSYSTSVTDSFQAVVNSNGQSYDRLGEIAIEGDGYGVLYLPNDTFQMFYASRMNRTTGMTW